MYYTWIILSRKLAAVSATLRPPPPAASIPVPNPTLAVNAEKKRRNTFFVEEPIGMLWGGSRGSKSVGAIRKCLGVGFALSNEVSASRRGRSSREQERKGILRKFGSGLQTLSLPSALRWGLG